jgi:hypothetical protein
VQDFKHIQAWQHAHALAVALHKVAHHFSIKSANETEHHLLSARDLDLVSPDAWQRFTAETIEIRKMIHGYRKKVIQSSRRAK